MIKIYIKYNLLQYCWKTKIRAKIYYNYIEDSMAYLSGILAKRFSFVIFLILSLPQTFGEELHGLLVKITISNLLN